MKKVHWAWAVCLGCTLMLLVSGGLSVNAFSVAQPYILARNGFTNTQTSMITTVRALAYLGCMFLIPRFYGKLGYRLGAVASVALAALAFVLFGAAKSLAAYYLAGLVAGLSYGFGSMVPASILISRWFREKHGLALGICAAGTGLATVAFSPIMTALIEKYSLAVCFYFLAGVSLLAALLVWLLVRESPEGCGLAPYGDSPQSARRAARREIALLSRGRWVALFVSMCFLGAIASPGFTHMMILFTTSGVPGTQASLAVSIFGFALMLGKCVYGFACDRLTARRANWLFGAILGAGLALCALSDLRLALLPFAAAVLYGFGVPMSTVGLSVWAEDFSAPERFDWALRLFQTGYGLGALVFSFMPGAVADVCGSYAPSYVIFLACGIFALLSVQSTYRRLSAAQTGAQR